MGDGFPFLLLYTLLGSFLLGLLQTGRWKIVLMAIVVVWGVRIGRTEIDLLSVGTVQAYAWFAFLSAAVWLPTFVVALVGSDLGMQLYRVLFAKEEEPDEKAAEPHGADGEEATEQ